MRSIFRTTALLTVLLLVGCGDNLVTDAWGELGKRARFTHHPDAETAELLSEIPYPADAERGEDYDIIVEQDGGQLHIANRSARRFDNVQLWLNQQYVGVIGDMPIGTGSRYSLREFVNTHGEAYPAGTFLAPDKAFPLTLAEIYDPEAGTRHRLIARTHVD